jgi:Txe/YoeB family toxin of Txe-Axe toxin-antitoxin module
MSTGFASEVKPATFNTYTKITKELGETKPSLQECYDLYNPVRIINDIYVELDQFGKNSIPAATIKNLFLKWTFAQRFHFKLSGELIANPLCVVSLEDLIKAKKATAVKENKYRQYLKTTTEFNPKYSDIKQTVKSFDAAEELKNLDTKIDQIITHFLTFPCFKGLEQSFPFKNVLTQKSKEAQEGAALLGVSSIIIPFHIDLKNQPIEKAIQCYSLAAQGGSIIAMHNLGVLLQGKGTPKTLEEAETWFRKAADKGYALARHNLGVLLKEKGTLDTKKEAKALFTETLAKGISHSLIPLAQLSDDLVEAENHFKEAIRLNVPNALIYYANFLREKDRLEESAIYQDLHEEENGITIDHSSESDTDSDSDLQALTPDLAVASSSSAIEAAPVASSSSKPNIAVEEPFIPSTSEETYQAPIIPKKQQKRDARNARMEEQIKRADEEARKAMLTHQPMLKTYRDITVTALPDAIGEITENEIKVQRLITMLANGETKRGKFEHLEDGLYSMRITKQDRLVFRITGGDLKNGITAIQIIEAKGHYNHLETKATQTRQAVFVQWSNLGNVVI